MFEKPIGLIRQLLDFVGAPYGIRTRVSALRGPHPALMDDRMPAAKGSENTQAHAQTGWLPRGFRQGQGQRLSESIRWNTKRNWLA